MLFVPQPLGSGFPHLRRARAAVPVWAERAGPTTWHPHHIAERYGLLTLIVLGESILAATVAVQSALASGEALSALAPLIVGGLLIVYSMWWIYFDRPVHDLLTSLRKAIVWGYGHYLVFAAAAAVGAGLAVAVDQATHHAKIERRRRRGAVAIPVAVYLVCLWFLHDRPEYRQTRLLGPVAAVLVLLTPFTGHAVPLTGAILSSVVAMIGPATPDDLRKRWVPAFQAPLALALGCMRLSTERERDDEWAVAVLHAASRMPRSMPSGG